MRTKLTKIVSNYGLFVMLLCFIVLTACTTFVDYFSGRSEACEIIARGKPAKAKIIKIFQTGTLINKNPVVGFVLEVSTSEGKIFEARTQALISYLDIPQIQPGQEVPVKYDPQQNNRVAIDLWDCN